jgi:5-methylcytosine-specific restriction protein A
MLSIQTAGVASTSSVSATYVRQRSAAVVEYALLRSGGSCESCGALGPFISSSSKAPFLEVHHMTRLTDGGPDAPQNVAAICPNCHKEIYHGEGRTKNDQLIDKVALIEGEFQDEES